MLIPLVVKLQVYLFIYTLSTETCLMLLSRKNFILQPENKSLINLLKLH